MYENKIHSVFTISQKREVHGQNTCLKKMDIYVEVGKYSKLQKSLCNPEHMLEII